MKTFTAALSVLVVVVFCYQATSSPNSVTIFGPCCDGYITRQLPSSRVVKYEHTGSHCFRPAVIFTTIRDKLVCANPNEEWVQNIINQLKGNVHS
ncbi:CCL5 protein, partial [Rhadina sibilatrix]|nr:CCL5 protein [Rhadina sibilatrix]